MTIVGFNFTKLVAERKGAIRGKININNNVAIKSVEPANLSLGKNKEDGVRFTFQFTAKYEPKAGEIEIWGDIIYMEEASKVKEILDSWKKSKKVSQAVMTQILNTTLTKCNIQALVMSRDINLPPPIPLPKVSAEKK
ncbi:hypothetical protein JXB02_02465 [Candidatus Woesearchaeota archaeon]|nr:hypothetical protein [Candidatus Woesearchaeota archaeon]